MQCNWMVRTFKSASISNIAGEEASENNSLLYGRRTTQTTSYLNNYCIQVLSDVSNWQQENHLMRAEPGFQSLCFVCKYQPKVETNSSRYFRFRLDSDIPLDQIPRCCIWRWIAIELHMSILTILTEDGLRSHVIGTIYQTAQNQFVFTRQSCNLTILTLRRLHGMEQGRLVGLKSEGHRTEVAICVRQ